MVAGTPRHRARRLLWVVVLWGLAGCGSRVPPPYEVLAADPSLTPSAFEAPIPTASVPSQAAPPSPDSVAAEASPTESFRPFPGSTLYQNGVITITLSATCARHGQVMTADIQAPVRTTVSMFARYSDGDPHGNMFIAPSDDQGRYTWTFVVPPNAPPGFAQVFAASGGPDNSAGGGGIGSADFTLVGHGQPCA